MGTAILIITTATLGLVSITGIVSLARIISAIAKNKSKDRIEQIKKQIEKYERMLTNGVSSEFEREAISDKINDLKSQIKSK